MNTKQKILLTCAIALLLIAGSTAVALAVSGAVSTTDNPGFVDTNPPLPYTDQACLNGQGVNCNIYLDKRDVWLSGLPVQASLGTGTYFFAVLVPGGQPSPNDAATVPDDGTGTPKNLSDDFDAYTNRMFSVDGTGAITNLGTHNFGSTNNKLQLFPYADTTNPGGVYILAVCSLADGYPVTPSTCKYDAFKVGTAPALDLTVKKDATPSYTRTFGWKIEKSADYDQINTSGSAMFNYTIKVTKDAGADSDWAVAGTITVHNPNAFAVSGVDVSDATPDGTCTVTSGTGLTVPAGGDATASYVCTFASNPGSGTNTATATWPDIGSPNTSATGTAGYVFGAPTKKVHDAIDVTDTNGGSWHFTDSGSVSYPVTYSDDPAGTCTSHENTATITQTGDFAKKTVKVCVGADLKVTKDATPTFKRTYNWKISKAVDPTLVKQVGGTATFNYTVKVWQTGFTDSNWAVSGKIHVVNPNDWEAITFDATDAVLGGVCTVTGGTGVTLELGASVDLPYTCTFAAQPAYNTDLTNTATATWNKATYFTPNGTATGEKTFQFTAPTTTVNKTVTVTDTFNGGSPQTLGTVTATDAEPWASATFNYARSIPVPTWNCVFYTNTAKIVETGQSASQTVKVCGPAKTGALSKGYWQNNNGQGIIKAGASTGGVCNSGTWLRQYAPFQNLGATASCAQVATYVYNIIKAADASGSSMNAMLKAQMLATALDVYFSDPALGGNKIGAPAPVGGVAVDLTKVKAGSGYQNVSSAFGATSLTVSQMLTYAAGQSNVGGSLWYGNVKSTQELAKNAFDAINNQWVFAP